MASNHIIARNECIVNTLQSLRRTLYNYAIAYRIDVEDLLQEAVIIMLETWPKLPQDANPQAYLHTVVRRQLVRSMPQDKPLSLDAPISENGLTLADTLACDLTAGMLDVQKSNYLIMVVHWAISKLPPALQIYTCETFEIASYEYPNWWPRTKKLANETYQKRRKSDMKKSVFKAFKDNPLVQELLTSKQRGPVHVHS